MIPLRVKAFLRRYGLRVFIRKKMPYGVDPWNDVARLSQSQPIKIAFDVGAHVGQTTRALARYFPQARILSFEPMPDTFKALEKNTRSLSRVTAYNIAFGAKNETKEMHVYGDTSTVNSFVPDAPFAINFPKPSTTCEIEVVTIDSFARKNRIERIDLLKVDTEGFDIQVLRGATSLFDRRAIRFVYSEFNEITKFQGSTGGVFLELYEFLTKYDFRLVAIYTDYIKPRKNFFSVRNALFVGNTLDWQKGK